MTTSMPLNVLIKAALSSNDVGTISAPLFLAAWNLEDCGSRLASAREDICCDLKAPRKVEVISLPMKPSGPKMTTDGPDMMRLQIACLCTRSNTRVYCSSSRD